MPKKEAFKMALCWHLKCKNWRLSFMKWTPGVQHWSGLQTFLDVSGLDLAYYVTIQLFGTNPKPNYILY